MLPDYYSGHDTYTRLSYSGPIVTRPAGSVGDYVQTLGQLDDSDSDTGSIAYFLLTSLGSSLAGGLVGYMSSGGSKASAMVGAGVLGGLTGIADAGMFASEGKHNIALLTGFMSLASLVVSFYAFTDMRNSNKAQMKRRQYA